MRRPVDSKLPPFPFVALPTGQHGDLSTPAQPANGNMLVHGGVLVRDLLPHFEQVVDRLLDAAWPRPKIFKGLLLLGRVRRHPLGLDVVALEEVRDEDNRAEGR